MRSVGARFFPLAVALLLVASGCACWHSRQPGAGVEQELSHDPIEANQQLGRSLDALLDDMIRLSLQPGNDEEENKAVSDQLDAVHQDAIQLYDELNRSERSQKALAPLVTRYWALRWRADQLIVAHGPIRRDLPAPFAEMGQELERLIALCRQEIHADKVDESRLPAVEALHRSLADLEVDVIWSGLRNRREDLADLRARFEAERKKGSQLFP